MSRSRRAHKRIVFTVLFSIILTILMLSAEFSARLWIASHTAGSNRPLTRESYYSPQFAAEQAANTLPDWSRGYGVMPDAAGVYFNISGGYRRTVGQPVSYAHTVWLFGSSTTFDYQVSDTFTLASDLQAMMPGDRVVNAGCNGCDTISAVRRLQSTPIKPGDVVIVYGGADDSQTVLFTAQKRADLLVSHSTCDWLLGHYASLALIQLACSWLNFSAPNDVADSVRLAVLVQSEAADYHRAIIDARQYVWGRNAQLVVVLEPYLYVRQPRVDELALLDYGAGQDLAERSLYPLIQEPDSLNLAYVLDAARQAHCVCYLDSVHLSARGDQIVARALYSALMTF